MNQSSTEARRKRVTFTDASIRRARDAEVRSVRIVFTTDPRLTVWGVWLPDRDTILIDGSLTGTDLAATLLHEIGHVILGDVGTELENDHEWLERWAVQSASLLDLVRRGRRAAPA